MPDNGDRLISASDLKDVESIYRRNTTPLRCRLGLHDWGPWDRTMTFGFHAEHLATGHTGEPIFIHLDLRLCLRCVKIQAHVVQCAKPDDMPDCAGGCDGCEDDEE